MANWRVQLVTRWTNIGTVSDNNHPYPLFIDEYEYIRWTDVTAQAMNRIKRPKPNTYIIEAEITDTVLTQLEGDNKYLIFTAEELTEDGAP